MDKQPSPSAPAQASWPKRLAYQHASAPPKQPKPLGATFTTVGLLFQLICTLYFYEPEDPEGGIVKGYREGNPPALS